MSSAEAPYAPERRQYINPVEFGELLGHLTAIERELRELKDRSILRLDNLEARVANLERIDTTTLMARLSMLERTDQSQSVWVKFVEKGVWGAVAVLCLFAMKKLGLI